MGGRGDATKQAEKVSLQHPRLSMEELFCHCGDHETLVDSAPISIRATVGS